MGKKITVDSATLMNKGLEVIEAHEAFGVPYKDICVLIHTQALLHSAAEMQDGSLLAQLAVPDMKIPIAYALAWPHRIQSALIYICIYIFIYIYMYIYIYIYVYIYIYIYVYIYIFIY